MRNQQLRKTPERANQPLMPLVGVRSFNLPCISEADYIELVDCTGREMHPGKRGKFAASEPKALTKLGLASVVPIKSEDAFVPELLFSVQQAPPSDFANGLRVGRAVTLPSAAYTSIYNQGDSADKIGGSRSSAN